MRHKFIFLCLLFSCVLFFNTLSFAQITVIDTALYTQSIRNGIFFSSSRLQENAYLYTGTEYYRYGHGMQGHPFFKSDEMQTGSVYYDGTLYQNVPMLYDLVNDQLIMHDFTGNFYMRLLNEKVGYFTLQDHLFTRIEQDSTKGTFISTNFYDKLYEGTITVFAKRFKKIETSARVDEPTPKIVEYDQYFIEKNGVYYFVDNQRAMLSIFADKKSEIKKFIHGNKINFKKDRENAIIKTSAYYGKLKG